MLEGTCSSTQFLDGNAKSHRIKVITLKNCIIFTVCATLSILLVSCFFFFYGPTVSTSRMEIRLQSVHEKFNFRLPKSIKPIHYRLRLHPLLEPSFTYSGRVTILMNCVRKTNKIVLHSEGLELEDLEVTTSETINVDVKFGGQLQIFNSSKVKILEIGGDASMLTILLEDDLVEGRNYTLDVHFKGKISDDLVGFYRTSNADSFGQKKWIVTTHFQPIYARRAFPCFDEPEFKAEFELSIARRTNVTTLSNMPLKEIEPIKNHSGWVWDHFKRSPPMPTYLVAFTICDYKGINVSDNKVGPVMTIWVPEHLMVQVDYAAMESFRIFKFFESYLQVKYPLHKLDMVVVPNLVKGAMENWGLISFRDTSLLLDESVDIIENRRHIFNIIAHEIAHQWFGNLVTMDWWSDLWLSEGFATYMATLAEDNLHPDWRSVSRFPLEVAHSALLADTEKSSHSLHTFIRNDLEIESAFDIISYNKAACLMRMLNFTMGEEKFRAGVKEYLRNGSLKSNHETNLWTSLSKFSSSLPISTSINVMMGSWTQLVGYPVISVTRDLKDSNVTISQSRFGNINDTFGNWYVPLTYITQTSLVPQTVFLDDNVVDIRVDNGKAKWILFNIRQTGYYRVNYDDENWSLLTKQLMEDPSVIPVENRAQLINDAFELANSGYIEHKVPFTLLKYLRTTTEHDYIPWRAAFDSLSRLESVLLESEHFGFYRNYMIRLLKPMIKPSTAFNSTNELDVLITDTLCSLRYKQYTDEAMFLFKELVQGRNRGIAVGHLYSIYCAAITLGTEIEWDYVWNLTLSPEVSAIELRTLYLALGCTDEIWKLYSYLEKTINGEITPQNVMYAWRSIANNDVGRLIGFKFLENNWEKIYDVYAGKPSVLQSIVQEFIYKLSSKAELMKVKLFYKNKKHTLKPIAGLIKNAIDHIQKKLIWKNKYMDTVLSEMSKLV